MTFTITREQLEADRAKLATNGVSLVGDSGTVSHSGVKINFTYVEPTLTLNVVSKPFFIKEGYIDSQIDDWFAQKQA